MAETKTWLTPNRIARGPEAANDELHRWSREKRRRDLHREMRGVFRPVQVYGDAAAMRRDALASRRDKVGSALMARDADNLGFGFVDIAIGLAAVGGGFLVGRWFARRRKAAQQPVQKVSGSAYVLGAAVLGSR